MAHLTEEEEEIISLYESGKWKEVIEKFKQNKFLPWIWPDEKNLKFIAKYVTEKNADLLISVGCGSGLLEWLISMATGLSVIGVELDQGWWNSKYAKNKFIPMIFTDDSDAGPKGLNSENAALLFCYFNNEPAFLNYIKNFKGDSFIIIGPGEGRGTFTNPKPFSIPESLYTSWKLDDHQEIRNSKDFIAVYSRK